MVLRFAVHGPVFHCFGVSLVSLFQCFTLSVFCCSGVSLFRCLVMSMEENQRTHMSSHEMHMKVIYETPHQKRSIPSLFFPIAGMYIRNHEDNFTTEMKSSQGVDSNTPYYKLCSCPCISRGRKYHNTLCLTTQIFKKSIVSSFS